MYKWKIQMILDDVKLRQKIMYDKLVKVKFIVENNVKKIIIIKYVILLFFFK